MSLSNPHPILDLDGQYLAFSLRAAELRDAAVPLTASVAHGVLPCKTTAADCSKWIHRNIHWTFLACVQCICIRAGEGRQPKSLLRRSQRRAICARTQAGARSEARHVRGGREGSVGRADGAGGRPRANGPARQDDEQLASAHPGASPVVRRDMKRVTVRVTHWLALRPSSTTGYSNDGAKLQSASQGASPSLGVLDQSQCLQQSRRKAGRFATAGCGDQSSQHLFSWRLSKGSRA